jgi:hypothetical protein
MAKCVLCKQKKGKRKCLVADDLICSLCCGETRTAIDCEGCPYYKETSPRNIYRDIPRIPIREMADNFLLQDYANGIEGTLCAFDMREKGSLTDDSALRTLELLLDKYYFKKDSLNFENPLLEELFSMVENTIKQDLADADAETLAKIIATIYFVAKKRSGGNREYLDFIHRFVGIRTDDGSRMMIIPND